MLIKTSGPKRHSRAVILSGLIVTYLVTAVMITANKSNVETAVLDGTKYRVPLEYHADVSKEGLYLNMARPGYGPLIEDKPGWQDNVIVLLSHNSGPMKDVYSNPLFRKADRMDVNNDLKPYFMEILVMGKAKMYVPDQDMTKVDKGMITCLDKVEGFKYSSCYLLTDYKGLKLKIIFDANDLKQWESVRDGVTGRLDEFSRAEQK